MANGTSSLAAPLDADGVGTVWGSAVIGVLLSASRVVYRAEPSTSTAVIVVPPTVAVPPEPSGARTSAGAGSGAPATLSTPTCLPLASTIQPPTMVALRTVAVER